MLKDKPEFWSSAIDQSGRLNGAFCGTIMMQQLNPGRVHVAPQGKERDVDEGDADTFEPLRALGCKEVNARNVEPATNPMGSLAEYVQGVTSLAAKYPKSRLCIFLGIGHSGISGGHIIGAMPSADGSVLLMDADAGEFCFPEASSLAKWMRKDLASLYRRMKYDKWFAVAYSKDK
jgi:hypothetical protein